MKIINVPKGSTLLQHIKFKYTAVITFLHLKDKSDQTDKTARPKCLPNGSGITIIEVAEAMVISKKRRFIEKRSCISSIMGQNAYETYEVCPKSIPATFVPPRQNLRAISVWYRRHLWYGLSSPTYWWALLPT